MLSIQEAGQQILRGNPGKFYIFVGQEFGIKTKYLESLVNHYNGEYVEIESVNDVLSMMRTKHLIPLTPKLYIARYDEDFIQSISDSTFKNIESTKIIGTIVCIYE
jgi:ABC-type antimicrobial peptide transport system ATPase subunit